MSLTTADSGRFSELAPTVTTRSPSRCSIWAGPNPRYHTVRPGETLWSIAVASHAGDPREGVWELQRRNGLSGVTIVPGQRLVLP